MSACTEKVIPNTSAIHRAPRITTLPLAGFLVWSKPMPTKPNANKWKVIILKMFGVMSFQPVEVGIPTKSRLISTTPMRPPIREEGNSSFWNNGTLARINVPSMSSIPIQHNAPRYG